MTSTEQKKTARTHLVDLQVDEDGSLVGVCRCGYLFTCALDMATVWELLSEHCDPIA